MRPEAWEASDKTFDANAKKVADLNRRLSRWTYIIRSTQADTFLLRRDQLVKAKTAPAEKKSAE